MIWEFYGPSGKVTTTDEGVAVELKAACISAGFEFCEFDPADNGAEFVSEEARTDYEIRENARLEEEADDRIRSGLDFH